MPDGEAAGPCLLLPHGDTMRMNPWPISGSDVIRNAVDKRNHEIVNGHADTPRNQVVRLIKHHDKLVKDLTKAARNRDNDKCNALRDQIAKCEARVRFLAGSCYSKTADYDNGRKAKLLGLKPDPDQTYSDAWWKGYREAV